MAGAVRAVIGPRHIPSDPILCPTEPPWPLLLADLAERGWSTARVARALLAPYTTVAGWDRKTPSYPYGQALLKLHAWVCGPELTQKRNDEAAQRAISDGERSSDGEQPPNGR